MSETIKKVSVVMSVYHEPIQWVNSAIKSILNQTYNNLEFIIILDDPENIELKVFLEIIQAQDSRIIVKINEKNLGLGASLNIGIKNASGEYIARMDADDISLECRIETEVNFLEENNLDLVASNIIDMNDDGTLTGKKTNYPKYDRKIKKYLEYGSCLPHPTWLGRREIFISNPYLPLQACQDYELLTRLAKRNIRFGVVEKPLLQYRLNSKGISSKKKIFQKVVACYVRKNYREKISTSIESIMEFIESVEGQKQQQDLIRYYEEAQKLKTLLKNRDYAKFLYNGVSLFISSREARFVAKERIFTRFI